MISAFLGVSVNLPIGPFTNAFAIILGGLCGAYIGHKVPERIRNNLTPLFGLLSLGLGILAITQVIHYAAVGLAAILGLMIGEYCYLEQHINRLANHARHMIERYFPPANALSSHEFLDKFVALLVLFAASGTGIFGAMHEGMTGDASILYIKTLLDFFTAAIFATTLGYVVITLAVPQMLCQLALFFLAVLILPLTNEIMHADFSAAGGLLMLATGFRIMGMKAFPVANMLPSLALVMPLSWLWERMMV